MAQLSDDCFAFNGPLLPVAEAERLIAERIAPVAEIETVPLAAARGRVVARDIVAPIDLPPFDNSAVDGLCRAPCRSQAAEGDTRLMIVDRITAGRSAVRALEAGEAIRIFTGAPMPAGADTVFMQEDTRAEGDSVIVPPGLKRGANSRAAGEDARKGATVLPAGRRLTASHVALAAAVGLTELPVRRRVRVAVFSTGDEIVEPGRPLPPAALFDANRYLLAGLIERLGASFTDLGILPDDKARLARAIADAAAGHDLVLTSGGVSTGEADHVKAAVETIGKLVFWRVGIKPGRPVAMGVVTGAAGRRGGRLCRAARQSGGGVRDLCAGGAAAVAAARRRGGAAAHSVAGARGLPLQEAQRSARICAGQAQAECRRFGRGVQARTGRRRRHHLADRDRWIDRIAGGRHHRRARRDRGFPLLRRAGGVSAQLR